MWVQRGGKGHVPSLRRGGRRGSGTAGGEQARRRRASWRRSRRAGEEERVGRRRRMPARENGRASDWAGPFPSLQQIARGRQVISHCLADCAPPCWVTMACQMSNCGKKEDARILKMVNM